LMPSSRSIRSSYGEWVILLRNRSYVIMGKSIPELRGLSGPFFAALVTKHEVVTLGKIHVIVLINLIAQVRYAEKKIRPLC
jgi:hypothetical protein